MEFKRRLERHFTNCGPFGVLSNFSYELFPIEGLRRRRTEIADVHCNAISPEFVSITLAPASLDYMFQDYLQGTHPASCNMLIMNILHLRPKECCQKIARNFRNALSAHVC